MLVIRGIKEMTMALSHLRKLENYSKRKAGSVPDKKQAKILEKIIVCNFSTLSF